MKKQQLRKELKSLRNQLSRDQVDRWSKKICANIMLSPQYRHADVIFGYLAFGNEPNIDIVLEQARLCLLYTSPRLHNELSNRWLL